MSRPIMMAGNPTDNLQFEAPDFAPIRYVSVHNLTAANTVNVHEGHGGELLFQIPPRTLIGLPVSETMFIVVRMAQGSTAPVAGDMVLASTSTAHLPPVAARLPDVVNKSALTSLTGSSATIGQIGLPYGSTQVALQSAGNVGDGNVGSGIAGVATYLSNGSDWDIQRNNTQVTLLASAARTSSTASSDQTNYNARGVLIYLQATAASGTGGLTVYIRGKDTLGNYYNLFKAPAAITATGGYTYQLGPGVNTLGQMTGVQAADLPRTWDVYVLAGDSSSYTYSVDAVLIL